MREASVGHQCPECVAEGQRTQRPARTAFGGGRAGQQGYGTKALIGLNVLFALLAAISGGMDSLVGGGWGGLLGGSTPLHIWGALVPQPTTFVDANGVVIEQVAGVSGGEYYRLVTSMFLHYGILHLALNMWALWILGRNLESALGPLRFGVLYLLSGLGGGVAVYYLSTQHGETAGASGAIFGLFAALFVVLRRLGRDASSIIPILVINLVFTFTVPGISWQGHIGGMITGGIVAAILAYAPRANRNVVQAVGCAVVLVALVGLVLARTVALTA
jgi:membrane associated rhomboid family serine protease